MCRKTLEGICNHHGITVKNLATALKKLRDQGDIESRVFDWAEAVKVSGNEAAHDVNARVSREDARDVLDLTEALLEYVFTFRQKFDDFQARRAKRTIAPEVVDI